MFHENANVGLYIAQYFCLSLTQKISATWLVKKSVILTLIVFLHYTENEVFY